MNESCHIKTNHVSYERVMSHMNESCHICMSHVTWFQGREKYIWGGGNTVSDHHCQTPAPQFCGTSSWISCLNFSKRYISSQKILTKFPGVPYLIFNHLWCCALISRTLIYMSVFHMCDMNESCQIWLSLAEYQSVMSHAVIPWNSHVTCEWAVSHMNESCHIWISHAPYKWVMSHAGIPYLIIHTAVHQSHKFCLKRYVYLRIIYIYTHIYTYMYIYVHIDCVSLIHSLHLSLFLCIHIPQDVCILNTHIYRCTYIYIFV